MNNKKEINTLLAIDTSCDETSVALTYKTKVLSNIVSSQIKVHKQWGGTVPLLAKREHEKRIDFVIHQAVKQAKINAKRFNLHLKKLLTRTDLSFIDAVAVTYGPGLSIALEVGISKAKQIAKDFNKPLIAVNHMQGHFYSSLAQRLTDQNHTFINKLLPGLGLLFSGGHSEFVLSKRVGEFEIIGSTLDDALGEAFDKIARMLNLGYPGGPIIEELAKTKKGSFKLPVAMQNSGDFNLSFSGLKTAVLYLIRDLKGENRVQPREKRPSYRDGMKPKTNKRNRELDRETIESISSSFQKSAFLSVSLKLEKILQKYPNIKTVFLGGGVISNMAFRKEIRKTTTKVNPNIKIMTPYSKKLFTDNAAMIGVTAFILSKHNKALILKTEKQIKGLERIPNLSVQN